jgi:hypothetical protein
MRVRHGVAALLAIAIALLITAQPAVADVSAATTALGTSNLYVDETAGATLNRATAGNALSAAVKIAILPAGAGDPGQLARQIGQALGGTVTVGVFVGRQFNAGSNALCAGTAGSLAARAVADNRSQLQANNDLTNTITDFAGLVGRAKPGCSGGNAGSNAGGKGSSAGWIGLGLLAVLGAGAIGGLVGWRRRRDRLALADARASVQPFYDRLAAEVGSLQAGDNAVARQALADASERFNSGGSQLASATRPAQVEAARRSLLEGLQASRTAREALGLDPGPELPPIVDSRAPQLTEPQTITAGGQQVIGYPAYAPGAPYYFAGGGGYAGGWYSAPFWQSLLIAEALTPGWGFGGGFGGGGYGSGYDSGFDAGRDSAQQDYGNSTGGDWGGGGGDWGGGGGDWGGGGGDSGGGGSW